MDLFIFDYSVVRKLDPSYEKYLCDNSSEENIQRMLDPFDEDAPVNIQVDGNNRRGMGLKEDELDIIDMMRDNNKVESSDDNPFMIGLDPNCETVPFADDSQKEVDDDQKDKISWALKPEHRLQPLNGRKINPLQLLPPKSVLDQGSSIYRTPQTLYTVMHESHKGFAKSLSRSRFSDASDKGKLRLINSIYWFDPIHNTMSECKHTFKSLIYNTETRRMYARRFQGKGIRGPQNRYKPVVRGIAFNTAQIHMVYSSTPPEIYIQFVQRLREIVLKDVPDAYVPHSEFLDKLLCGKIPKVSVNITAMIYLTCILMLQHKFGKRIDWLDSDTFYQVSSLLNEQHISNYFTDEQNRIAFDNRDNVFMNYRRYRLAAIRKCIKDKPGLKSFTKALFGKQYRKIAFILLLQHIDSHDLSRILATVIDGRMPKNIYHYIVNMMKDTKVDGKIEDTLNNRTDTLNTIANTVSGHDTEDLTNQRLYTCLKTYRKFNRLPAHRDWNRWKDMYNMAERLHIRIRPNKFTCANDIDTLHDGLSEIHNRDRKIQREYADVVFEPFAHPDKEYGDGFKFVFLGTPADLTHEGTTMHHCVGSYADRCIRGSSIIFSMRKGDRSYITIELDGLTYRIHQQYTIKDNMVKNQDILDIITQWNDDIVDMHMTDDKEDTIYQVICERKVIEQKEIRRKEAKKQLTENKALNRLIQSTKRIAPAVDDDVLGLQAEWDAVQAV